MLTSNLCPRKHFSKRRERYLTSSKRGSRQKMHQSEIDLDISCESHKWLRNSMCAIFILRSVATTLIWAGSWMINALILLFRNRSYRRFNSQPCKRLSQKANLPLTISTVSRRESDITYHLLIKQLIPCTTCPYPYNWRSMNAMARFRSLKALLIFVRGNSSRGVEGYPPLKLFLWSSLNNFRRLQTLQFIARFSMHLVIVAVKRASLRAQRRSRPVTLVIQVRTWLMELSLLMVSVSY
jgi:hypothetical protein